MSKWNRVIFFLIVAFVEYIILNVNLVTKNSHSIFLKDMRFEENSPLRKQVVLFSCPLTSSHSYLPGHYSQRNLFNQIPSVRKTQLVNI